MVAGKKAATRSAEGLEIVAAHAFVADRAGDLAEPRLERGAALGRVEDAGLGLPRPDHLDQRPGLLEHGGHRLGAGRADEVVGVLPAGEKREAEALAGLDQRQSEVDGAVGGAQARAVAVEAEDRLVGHPPEDLELALGERGAERGDGVGEAGADHLDRVDIALDRDHRAGVVGGLPRLGAVIEERALVEELGLRRVEVFRRHVGGERAAAEADDAAAEIGDREDDAVAEAVEGDRHVVAGDEEPGLDHLRLGDVLARRDAPSARSGRTAHSRSGSGAGDRGRGRD